MKRLIVMILIAGVLAVFAGCSKSKDSSQQVTTETAGQDTGSGTKKEKKPGGTGKPGETGFVVLPAYTYSGDDVTMNAMLDTLMEERGSKIRQADITIPDIVVVKSDDSDPQDILVWNYARAFSYKKEGTELVAVDGVEVLGLMHLKETVNGFEVTSWEKAAYGDDETVMKSLKKICRDNWNLTYDMVSAYKNSDVYHTAIIRMYVDGNQLDIDRYTIGKKTWYLSDIATIEDSADGGIEGTFVKKEDDSSLEIRSLGNGRYSVKMALAGKGNLGGSGKMEGETLNFTLKTDDKAAVTCVAVLENDTITVNVVDSDWNQLSPGETLEFYSAADVSTETGAPSTAEAIE